MNELHTICYLSKGDKELKDFDLENLYTKLKAKNHLSKITGILINDNGYFFQVLEGETKKLKKLYSLISLDERHSNVIKIIDTQIKKRIFDSYKTGFEVVDSAEDKKLLIEHLNSLRKKKTKHIKRIVNMAENFMKDHK